MNWDDLLRKDLPAPFVPRIACPTDVSNFSEEFTSMEAVDSPSEAPEGAETVFRGYSFVAPSILFAENNVISDDLFRRNPNPDKKPTASNLVGCILQVRILSSYKNTYGKKTVTKSDIFLLFFLSLQKSPFFSQYEVDLKEKILGDGSFSVCRRCVHKQTRQVR